MEKRTEMRPQEGGCTVLVRRDSAGTITEIDLPFTWLTSSCVRKNRLVCIAGSPVLPPRLVEVGLVSQAIKVLRDTSATSVDDRYVSVPEAASYRCADGVETHGWVYFPVNPDFEGLDDILPPLLVLSHGGLTSENLPLADSRGES